MVLQFASWSAHSRFDVEVNELSSRIKPHLRNHCLKATSVTILSDNNCETTHIKSATGHKSDHSSESCNDRPSVDQQKKMSEALSSFLHGHEATSADKENTAGRLQAHLPRRLKHPQRQISASIIKWRFPTTCMKTTHMASKGRIPFLPRKGGRGFKSRSGPIKVFRISSEVVQCLVSLNFLSISPQLEL